MGLISNEQARFSVSSGFRTFLKLESIMDINDATTSALEQVDVGRRGFLGKLLTSGAAVAALPAMSTVVYGNDQQGACKCKGSGGKGNGGKRDRPTIDA